MSPSGEGARRKRLVTYLEITDPASIRPARGIHPLGHDALKIRLGDGESWIPGIERGVGRALIYIGENLSCAE